MLTEKGNNTSKPFCSLELRKMKLHNLIILQKIIPKFVSLICKLPLSKSNLK
jgi:hypothetical protein